ncbi:MAG TPA: DUF433 domain-containing protein [Candidatus Binataceae bacterium]|nr:DUF433 domain-containing protein [Candidatus Binataceae bacterium]
MYEIAAMLEQGESEDELLAGYPSLRPEQLALARIYAAPIPDAVVRLGIHGTRERLACCEVSHR